MKIFFFWPLKNVKKPTSEYTEPYEFYKILEKNNMLVDNFDKADYILYMNIWRNYMNMPFINKNDLNKELINQMNNHSDYKKDIIIDYNDWSDLRNCQEKDLQSIGYYFKRSIVKKENFWSSKLIEYPREIIPISYGIRSDFIEYEQLFKFTNYNYDVCCLFNNNDGGIRSTIPDIVNNYNGPKFIGRIDCPNRYGEVNTKYFEILKTSKIIITANPPNWEGDFRLWEALLMGNLVLCDKMLVPSIMTHPLINKKHLVYYNNMKELEQLIEYYINNNEERIKIGKEGREYCLKYHKFSDRATEILNILTLNNDK